MEAISIAEQIIIIYTKMKSNILYILPLIFPLICFLFSLKRMCLSFKSEKKDVFGILSDTVLLIVLVTSNMIYLKLPIDNKSITIEQVMLLISYTAWIILEYFEILKLTKMDSDKKIEKIITFVYIIILVMSIMRMA